MAQANPSDEAVNVGATSGESAPELLTPDEIKRQDNLFEPVRKDRSNWENKRTPAEEERQEIFEKELRD